MAQDLVSYIRQQLQAGYNMSQIKSALLKYGYQSADIDAAARQAYSQPHVVKHIVHFSPATIAIVAAVLILVGGALFFIPRLTGGPKELLDVKADISSVDVTPGSKLEFDVELFNLGSDNRYDVVLRYLIIDSNNKIMKTKEETVAIETRFTSKADVTLPSNLGPGNYQLKVIARYNGKIATAVESFSVEEPPEPAEPVEPEPTEPEPTEPEPSEPIVCDDNDPCTQDALVGGECKFVDLVPCCGNNKCDTGEDYDICPSDCEREVPATTEPVTIWEQINQIEDEAEQNPESAAEKCSQIDDKVFRSDCYLKVAEVSEQEKYCDMIDDERTRDKCRKEVAIATEDAALCDKIIRDSTRDQCYMGFVTIGNYEFCDRLTNPFLQQNCNQLKEMHENLQ